MIRASKRIFPLWRKVTGALGGGKIFSQRKPSPITPIQTVFFVRQGKSCGDGTSTKIGSITNTKRLPGFALDVA
jgi:hypothetical protein